MLVKQDCFKTIKSFSGNPKYRKSNEPQGVYLWGFSLEKDEYTPPSSSSKFFPYYVGKVDKKGGSLFNRTQEHIAFLVGGNYSIFNIENSRKSLTKIGNVISAFQEQYNDSKKSDAPSPNIPSNQFPNLLHFPEGINTLYNFFDNGMIRNEIDWMIKHFCITYYIPQTNNKSDIVDLEKVIGNLVGYDNLITKPLSNPTGVTVEIMDNPDNILLQNYEDLFKHCRGQMAGVKFGF